MKPRIGARSLIIGREISCTAKSGLGLAPSASLRDKAAAGAEALHEAVLQRFRQGRQQVDGLVVALEEELGDAGRAAEVTVNLERRMGVEEVGIGAARHAEAAAGRDQRELVRNQLESVITVQHARPEADLPAHRPARGGVSTLDQRVAHALGEHRRAVRGDLVAGIKAPEVRDVAVVVGRAVPVLKPLLQLAVLADLHRRQAAAHRRERVGEGRVAAEDAGRALRIGEEVGHELVVHRDAREHVGLQVRRTVLRRVGGRHHEVARVRIFN